MKISNVKMLPISNANSNLGLATLVLATLATLATFAASALPLVWRADWPDAKPVETLVHRGTDVELQPQWRINKEPADTNGWTYTTFCQTNAVGPWFGPMPGAFFSHTNDVGAASYNLMVRAETPDGAVNYTAFARFRMLDSPGFEPGSLPLPAKSIDFADVATYNAPWLLPDATNDFARAGDIAPTITNTVTKQFVESLGIDAGTTNYADLANKPAVNGVTLTGDKTAAALGLATAAQGATADTAYQKPQAGIPASDMAQEVQTSLGKADTALQPSEIVEKANRTELCAAWAANTAYTTTSFVIHSNAIYRCTTAHTSTSAWDSLKWAQTTIAEMLALYLPLTGDVNANLTLRGILSLINRNSDRDAVTLNIRLNSSIDMWEITGDYPGTEDIPGFTLRIPRFDTDEEHIYTFATTADIPSISGLAPLASPAFTGTPTAPTPAANDNSMKVATTAFVKTAVDNAAYTLPTATASTLGGVKVGSGLSISNGVLSVTGGSQSLDYVLRINPEDGSIYYTTPTTNRQLLNKGETPWQL